MTEEIPTPEELTFRRKKTAPRRTPEQLVAHLEQRAKEIRERHTRKQRAEVARLAVELTGALETVRSLVQEKTFADFNRSLTAVVTELRVLDGDRPF